MNIAIFFQFTLYLLAIILFIVLIFLGIQAIVTLNKVDKLVDDIQEKSRKLDGLFDAIDGVTDTISSVNNKVFGIAYNLVNTIVEKFKGKKRKDN